MTDTDDARALFREGRQAMAERRHGDALTAFRKLVDRFGPSRDVTVDRIVGNAMHGMALNFALIERDREALATYDEIIARYRDAEDPALRGHLARALLNRGLALEQMGDPEQAIETWDEVIARFDADERFRAPALLAREQKASTLRALDRLDEALALYDDVLLRAADADPRQVQRHTDLALSNKAFVLLLQDRLDEAIVVADATVERLDDSERPADLAIAVLNLAGALVKRGRLEEALDVYEGLIERLGTDPAPEVLEHLIVAVMNEVEVLGMLERTEDAEEAHADVLQRFGDKVPSALQRAAARNEQDEAGAPVVAGLLLKQAIALFQLERDDEALICVNDLIERFSDETNPEVERVLAMARAFREQLREED